MNQPIKGRGLNGKRFNPVEALARIAQGGITKAAGITPAEVALIPEITAARLYSAARCGGRSQTTARVLFALENERRVAFEQGRAQAFFKANSNPIVPAEPAAVVDRSPVDYAKLRELVAKVEVSAGSVSLFDALALANAVLVREPLTVSACTRKITYAGTERTVRVVVCPTGVIAVSSLDTTFNLPWDAGLWHVDDNGRSSLKGIKAFIQADGETDGLWLSPEAVAFWVAGLEAGAVWYLNGHKQHDHIPATGVYGNA